MRQLEESPDIRLCVSSRPWSLFVDEFGTDPERTLKLEDLTREDIRQYVSDKLNKHSQFETLTHVNTEYVQMVEAVVDRAQGVFLWVYLVVRTLLEGLTYHGSVSTLYRRLEEFPPDLESFFQHLLDSVAPIYRKKTALYFKITTIAQKPLLAMLYSYLDEIEDDPNFALVLAQSEPDRRQVYLRQEQPRRKLDACSRGLLELVFTERYNGSLGTYGYVPKPASYFEYEVNFLHRTVRDFLHQSADVHSSLQVSLGNENFSLTARRAILAEMKAANFWTTDFEEPFLKEESEHLYRLVEELFFFVSASLAEDPDFGTALMTLAEAVEVIYQPTAIRIDQKYEPFLFAGLTARADFLAYVHKTLAANARMLHEAPKGDDSEQAECEPALSYALDLTRSYPQPLSTRACTCLLEAGADPNEA